MRTLTPTKHQGTNAQQQAQAQTANQHTKATLLLFKHSFDYDNGPPEGWRPVPDTGQFSKLHNCMMLMIRGDAPSTSPVPHVIRKFTQSPAFANPPVDYLSNILPTSGRCAPTQP